MKWIIERVNNKAKAVSTPVGLVPDLDDLDTSGLNIPRKNLEKLFEVKIADWKNELADTGKFFKQFGKNFPPELENELAELQEKF